MTRCFARRIAAFGAVCILTVHAGCSGRTSEPSAPVKHTPPAAAEEPNPSASTPARRSVELKPLSVKEYDRLVERHRGKVLLVDFWATWCDPCLKLLPHTAELAEKYRDRGLEVVTVSLDEASEADGAREALAKTPARLDNYLLAESGADETWAALQIRSGLPHLKVYDRSGKLRHTLQGERLKPAIIDGAVEELLAE